ncbi:hypothetical protein [Mycolicibacterium iranicum]|uniref:Glycosyltransferase RgtA/B/C/D-like domain-containing protein n=1 Tax=Mycolicibacterium iranicum TaxID=912594 RepID=A0ABT4HAR1_MYCIR|nr:hypothetical protein [Mycolicibacterium iranicum]MCZ0727174.1 hypothetical protein [Mycolicibacterium iranicum]
MPVRMVDLAAVGAAAGAVALMSLPSAVRAIALVVFIAIGPGAAVLTWVRIPRRVLLSTVPVLGMAIVTLVAITAMWSYRWNPVLILWAQMVGVGGSSVYWYYQHRDSIMNAARRWHWRRVGQPRWMWKSFVRSHLSLVLSALAVVVWAVAVPDLPGTDAGYHGLLFSKTGPLLAVSIVLCTWALLIAVRQRQLVPAAVAVAAAIVVARVTVVVATEVPLYDWTYKHLAVVDYIMVYGRIQPDGTDIYAQWAAFFTTWAWFCDVTGITAMTVAHVFAPAMHVLMALTVYTAARVIGRSRRTALTAAFIAEIVNWVGQDYFSPQAWTIVLVFGMFALLLASPRSRACGVLAIPVFAATVPTHQLTPFWAIGATCALCLFKRAKPWWVALVMVLIAVCYLLLNLEAVAPYGLFSGGSPIENASTNVVASGLPARDFTAAVVRGLTVVVVVSAFACAVWMWRRKRPVLTLAILAFSSFGLLLGQSYGGEAIFRVYLYSILGCALLIAPAVVAAIDGVRGRARLPARTAAVLGVTGASVAGLHGYVALWPMVFETRPQIDLMETLTRDADLRTRVVMVRLGGMPTRLNASYVDLTLFNSYFDEPLDYARWNPSDPTVAERKATFPDEDDLMTLDAEITEDASVVYMVFSEQSNKAIWYYGDFRADAVEDIEKYLSRKPQWTLIYQNGETKVWRSVNENLAPQDSGGP